MESGRNNKAGRINDRRRFLQGALATGAVVAAIPLAALLGSRTVLADGSENAALPPLSLNDPTAKALGYVEDVSAADASRTAGSDCANCALYQGKANAADGPCQIFPGKSVAAKGWCKAWVKAAE